MSRSVRIVLLIVFALLAAYFGWQFKVRYDRSMANRKTLADSELASVQNVGSETSGRETVGAAEPLGWWGAGLVISLLGLGSLTALELTQFFGSRAARAYYDETQVGSESPDYEKADEACNRGDYLDAIGLLREYLAHNPREIHAAIRIAEIYEKDLRSPLAAALEYEEVLKQKLPRERWGWTAIHLCNLYSGPLHQTQKAIDLLQRIDDEYGDTAAGRKARSRLEQLVDEGIIPPLPPSKTAPEAEMEPATEEEEAEEPEEEQPAEEPPPPPAPLPDPGPQLPPGFRPRNP